MCSSDEDVVVSKSLIEKTDAFTIEPKERDYITCCDNLSNSQLPITRKQLSKLSTSSTCSWFYLWFFVIIWVPVAVFVSFTILDPWLALLSVGMFVLSMYLIVIVLSLYYFRHYELGVVAQTIWWQEFLVLFTFIMGFSISYNGFCSLF